MVEVGDCFRAAVVDGVGETRQALDFLVVDAHLSGEFAESWVEIQGFGRNRAEVVRAASIEPHVSIRDVARTVTVPRLDRCHDEFVPELLIADVHAWCLLAE
jgi:hypothetical protein